VISALPDVQLALKVNRIVPGIGIPHPLGDPRRGSDGERRLRRAILRTALRALSRPVDRPTLFTVDEYA
jgi:glycine reductase